MILFSLIRESLAALWANRLRSGLTVLGMTLGVTSVIAIVSTVEGMQNNLEDAFASLGSNTFMVTRFGFGLSMQEYLERMHRRKLTRGLIEPIQEGCPDCAEVGAETYASDPVKYGSRRMGHVSVEGSTPNILDMRDLDVAVGRYLSWEDDARRRQVAFLGHRVYERLFEGMNAIGEKIRIGKHEFVVIGVAEELGGMLGEDMDEFISIPLATHQKLYQQPGNPVNLVISAVSLERREPAMDQVRVVLRSARHVSYDDGDDFTIVTPDAILSFINDFTAGFRIVMISLPLLSIVIGGIVIMNIMMISVTERTREIGIRKSLGARRRHILTQFLYESTFMSLLGGSAGILFGIWIGKMVLTSLLDINVAPTTLAIILGFGISTAVGLFFGIYPAYRASRFDPIRALSYE
ncbi:MAG: ABC transporter permease [candidate division Zixibacteria bacterium]|nr:ABC transporter permease [candidate division Zixibacteria bacterium]